MIILEEASRLDYAVFSEVIVPLLGVRNTALIGISTPLEENNFYSQMLLQKKPNGDPLFNVVEITLLCDKCKAAGELTCPHNTEMPPWKTGQRQELVKQLMSNDKEMYKREQLGINSKNDTSAFNSGSVDRLCNNYVVGRDVIGGGEVFIAVDPAGGGASCMALASATFSTSDTLLARVFDSSTTKSSINCFIGWGVRVPEYLPSSNKLNLCFAAFIQRSVALRFAHFSNTKLSISGHAHMM